MYHVSRVFWLTAVILWGLPDPYNTQGMGPFEIDFRFYGLCPDVKVKNPAIYNTKFSKIGRGKNYTISFDVNARYPISDNITFKADLSVKTHNGFKQNFFHIEGPLVTSIKTYVPNYYKQVKFPVPPGNYSIKDLPLEEPKHDMIPTFFYRTFKVVIKLYMKNELLSCTESIVVTQPRTQPMKNS